MTVHDAGNRLANLGQPPSILWLLAIPFGHIKHVDYLVEKGADFGKTDDQSGVVQGPGQAIKQSAAIDRKDLDHRAFGRTFRCRSALRVGQVVRVAPAAFCSRPKIFGNFGASSESIEATSARQIEARRSADGSPGDSGSEAT